MCKIEGCDAKPVAKGLCAKHYMRQRRHGDAAVTGKPGPKPDVASAMIRRDLFPDWSPRTLARYMRAMRMAREIAEITGEDHGDLVKRMVTANRYKTGGSFSVVGFEASMEIYADRVAEREADERSTE